MEVLTSWLNKKRTVLYMMILAFIIRAGFGIALGERYLPMADQIVFDELAKNISSGKGLMITERLILPPEDAPREIIDRYVNKPERIRDLRMNALWGILQPGKPSAFIEPFVPLVFAGIYKVFGPGLLVPRLLQSLLDALVVGMIFGIGMMAFPKSRAPGIAALIYVFYPFSIMFTGALITQPIYLFLQCASIYYFYKFMHKPGWLFAVIFGLIFGMTILARISIITFAPFFLIALLVQKFRPARWFPAIMSLVLAALLLIPWAVRNNRALGEPLILPTKGGRNLWEYNNQHFTRERLNKSVEDFEGVDVHYYKFGQKYFDRIRGKQFLEFPEFTDESEIERDQILNHNVKQFIMLNPGTYIKLCFYRFYQFFRITPSHHQHLFFKLVSILSFGWILPLSFLGIGLLLKYWRELSLVLLLIFYNTGVHTLTASGIPHRLPIDPFLILFAAFTVHWLLLKLDLINREEFAAPKVDPKNKRSASPKTPGSDYNLSFK